MRIPKSIFLLSLLFAFSSATADEEDHNISFSCGFFNLTGASVIASNAIAESLGADDDDDIDVLTWTSFNVAYGYELWEKLEVGGILTYSYFGSGHNFNTLTLMPKAKFNWINAQKFRFYSQLAIGPSFLFNSEHFNTAALWQVSLLGFEFGSEASFFFEFGIGQAGGFATGVKFNL